MLLSLAGRYCTDSVVTMSLVGWSGADLAQDLPSTDRSELVLRLPHRQNTTTSG